MANSWFFILIWFSKFVIQVLVEIVNHYLLLDQSFFALVKI